MLLQRTQRVYKSEPGKVLSPNSTCCSLLCSNCSSNQHHCRPHLQLRLLLLNIFYKCMNITPRKNSVVKISSEINKGPPCSYKKLLFGILLRCNGQLINYRCQRFKQKAYLKQDNEKWYVELAGLSTPLLILAGIQQIPGIAVK
jgi:hypothetical protein